MTQTNKITYNVILKELGEGNSRAWIFESHQYESHEQALPLDSGVMYIKLRNTTTEAEAVSLADALNMHIDRVIYL